ncbi:MAG TPA: NAD-dependent epimerase/dehydratase family protein [Steroidobacteraceae bacterium]|nr:NAD-dependent epimerase/dehydratase family protein [Steroidobacteraceae bacterium]
MKLLITGATGFIGSQLALEARAAGHDVVLTGLVTNTAERERCERLHRAGFEVQDGSLRVPAFARRIVSDCDAVIHLASAQRTAAMPGEYFFDTNVEATRLLLESSLRTGVKRFVLGSTVEVYDSGSASALSEDSPVAPRGMERASKLAAEELVHLYRDRLQTTIVRIAECYGPEDFQLLKLLQLIERGVVPEIAGCRNLHQPIHVKDVARGLLRALEHDGAIGERFVLAGPAPITTRAMIEASANAMDARVHYARMPLVALVAAAALAEAAAKRFAFEPKVDRRCVDFYRESLWFSTEKAKNLLHFEATIGFQAGVRDLVSWYRQRGYLRPATTSVRNIRTVRSASDIPLDAMGGSYWQLSDVFEHARDPIIVWELDEQRIVYWNRAAEDLYGFTSAEVQGRVTHSLLSTDVDGGIAEITRMLSGCGTWVGRLRHRKKDNTEVAVDAYLTKLAHQDGRRLVLEVHRPLAVASKALALHPNNAPARNAPVRIGISAPAA